MRTLCLVLVFSAMSFCCSREASDPSPRPLIRVDGLGVAVRATERAFFLSDKRGGFVTGTLGGDASQSPMRWSVDGREIVTGIDLRVDGQIVTGAVFAAGLVYPHEVRGQSADGVSVILAPVEQPSVNDHVLLVIPQLRAPKELAVRLHPGRGFGPAQGREGATQIQWKQAGGGAIITLAAGAEARERESWLVIPAVTSARVLLILSNAGPAGSQISRLADSLDSLRRSRHERMERILNTSYLATSDTVLNKAISWMKLSLDALVVEERDTFAVAGLPWDGSISGRDNAQSIVGLGLATGDFVQTAAIIRSLARWQDTVAAHRTFGRIPDRVFEGSATYRGADIAPWLVRETYEQVACSNDTALVRGLFGVVRRSIEGTMKYHADETNLLTHSSGETWMGSERFLREGPRGAGRGDAFRAVEVQLLWHFEQLIGSFVAEYVGDSARASSWSRGAATTSEKFNTAFIDTTRRILFDHLDADGKGIAAARPNPLFALEILGNEAVQQKMIRDIVTTMVYPHGVGTLASTDPAFRSSAGGSLYNGLVWTWLTGQAVYALTRYDRADLAYRMTRHLALRSLSADVVGAIPQAMEVFEPPGEGFPRAAGLQASAAGMAEFVRSVYQDYLGIRVDAPSNLIRCDPKLPPEINEADFTVFSGVHPLHGSYRRGEDVSRITMTMPDITSPMRLNFVWVMKNGDAWRGGASLVPGVTLRIVMSADEVLAYQGDRQVPVEDQWKMKDFSRAKEIAGLEFAKPRK